MTTDTAKIAASLTKGCRYAIIHAHRSEVMNGFHVPLNTHARVGRRLFEAGLMRRPPGWALNAKGERVREYLLKEADHD